MKYTTTERDRSEALLRWSAVGLALAFFAGVAACTDGDRKLPVGEVAIAEIEVTTEIEPSTTFETPVAIHEERVQRADAVPDVNAQVSDARAVAQSDRYSLGIAAWRGGDPEGAEEHLRAWVAHRPDHAKGRVNLARALIEIGRPYEAREHAGIATDLDPGSSAAWRTMARAQAQSGDCSSALASYEEALLVDPEDVWALNNMGYLLIEHGRFEDAIGPLALAVTLDGANALFRSNLLAALEGAGRDLDELDAFVTGQLAERYIREREPPPGGDPWPHGRGM
ncbi:MAG: tetratricopeptide repeat protein [Gemmatimonadetes bacterium]|nr:tetratricopeptide repeat protein [Gemmatimonadota bacterium]MYE95663.1 tetratricopeptide repeat protein [Gemmatimonadota bacterium]MYJ12715.1 tetratricopeptide repeat protein [Gemmatimonadota bacterium]